MTASILEDISQGHRAIGMDVDRIMPGPVDVNGGQGHAAGFARVVDESNRSRRFHPNCCS